MAPPLIRIPDKAMREYWGEWGIDVIIIDVVPLVWHAY